MALGLLLLIGLPGCGGGGGSNGSGSSTTPPTYSVGGSISGLSHSGLVLTDGTTTVSPQSGASSFVLSTAYHTAATYGIHRAA